jgi:hypothetical protein
MAGALLATPHWLTVCGNPADDKHNQAGILGDLDIFQTSEKDNIFAAIMWQQFLEPVKRRQ